MRRQTGRGDASIASTDLEDTKAAATTKTTTGGRAKPTPKKRGGQEHLQVLKPKAQTKVC